MTTDSTSASSCLRELREDDAPEVAVLFRAVYGESRLVDADEVASWVANEELDPAWLRVLEIDGRIVGYGDMQITGDAVAVDIAAPRHWEIFCDWAEENGRAAGARHVRLFLPAGHELEAAVARRGYRLWRSSYTMEVVLDDEPPAAPTLPEPFVLRRYRPDDAEPIRVALNEAFSDDPFHHEVTATSFREFYLRARGFDPSLWLLAWDGEQLAGFLLAYPERGGERDLGWVNVLGVRPQSRRNGLGEALLRTSLRDLHARGLRKVGLGVDTENLSGAVRLYERVGMHVVRQGNNWRLDL